MKSKLQIRKIKKSDARIISESFRKQGWEDKTEAQYERYFEFQENGARDVLIAEWKGAFAGYVTIKWQSDYLPFRERAIPEIVDFNVLKKYQRKGIGTALMDEAEGRIKLVSDFVGIGFGVYQDYGAAQILYIHRGYVPDGNGICKDGLSIKYGETLTIDDSVVFHLTKKL